MRERGDNHIIEADLRERLEELKDEGEPVPSPYQQYIPEEGRKSVSTLKLAVDTDSDSDILPDKFEDSKVADALAEVGGTETLNETLVEENVGMASFMKGKRDRSLELPETYSVILDELDRDASNIMIRGSAGTGKSTKAIDIAHKAVQFGKIDKVMSNLSIYEPEDVDYWTVEDKISEILEFSQEEGEKLLILDEISRVLNRKAGNKEVGYDAEALFSKLLPAVRKVDNGNLKILFITHRDDKDVVKVIREYINMVIHSYDRDTKKKAYIYQDNAKESPRRAYHRFTQGTVDADHHTTSFRDITHPHLQIDTDSSARLELDFQNIDQDKFPEIFNLVDADEQFKDDDEEDKEFARCQKKNCSKHTRNTSKEEADNIIENDYCFDHHSSSSSNQDETCKVESCKTELGLDDDGFCPRHDIDDL